MKEGPGAVNDRMEWVDMDFVNNVLWGLMRDEIEGGWLCMSGRVVLASICGFGGQNLSIV